MFPKDYQLNLIQIGVMLSRYFTDEFPYDIPSSLDQIRDIAFKELGVEIKRGDDIERIRDEIREALTRQ